MRKLSVYAACAALGLAAGAAGAQQSGTGTDTATGSGDGSGAPLSDRVAANLEQSDAVDATRIEVEPVTDVAVELSGLVSTNGEKQEASVVAIQSNGVQFVRNNLEVDTG